MENIRYLFILFCTSLFISVNAQIIVIEPSAPSVDLNNQTVDIIGLPSDTELILYAWLTNTGNQTISLKCKKTEVDVLNGTLNQNCWVVCPPWQNSGSNPVEWLYGGNTETIVVGDTLKSSFSDHYNPNNLDGCSLFKYEWYDEEDTFTPVSTVFIRYLHTTGACTAAINEDLDVSSFKIFPNPAKESVVISLDESINHNDLILDIYDIIGKKVYSTRFISQLNSNNVNIDVHEFKQGVYIVSLFKNGVSLKSKILIVEH